MVWFVLWAFLGSSVIKPHVWHWLGLVFALKLFFQFLDFFDVNYCRVLEWFPGAWACVFVK